MKVILLKDVAKIGRRFEVLTVPDGFALNKLIPKNLAQFATPENLKRIQTVASKQKEHQVHDTEQFLEILKKLEGTAVAISVEANSEGRMFQALKAEAVALAIHATSGFTIAPENIIIKTPIKSIGEHVVELVSGKTRGNVTIVLNSKSK